MVQNLETKIIQNYNKRYNVWENAKIHKHENLWPAPIFPTEAEFNANREKILKNRVLPPLPQLFKILDVKGTKNN